MLRLANSKSERRSKLENRTLVMRPLERALIYTFAKKGVGSFLFCQDSTQRDFVRSFFILREDIHCWATRSIGEHREEQSEKSGNAELRMHAR